MDETITSVGFIFLICKMEIILSDTQGSEEGCERGCAGIAYHGAGHTTDAPERALISLPFNVYGYVFFSV